MTTEERSTLKSIIKTLEGFPPHLRTRIADMLAGAALALAELSQDKEEN